jgi:hypothetical protein
MKAEGRPHLTLSPNTFSVADFVGERNTDCIADGAKFVKGKGGAEGFGDFMNNPG